MKTVEVFFSKRFDMRDDQPDIEPIKTWTRDLGLTYVSHRRVNDEEDTKHFSFDDLVLYVCTGEASTPEITARMRSLSSLPEIAAVTEPDNQPVESGTD